MRTDKWIFLFCLITLGGLTSKATAQFDQVYGFRGSPTNGIISDASTPTEIVIEVSGSKRSIPVNEVRRITLADDPPELRRGRDNILTGQIEAGYDDLRKVNAAEIKRPLTKADLQYYLAYCEGKLALTGGGDKGAAAKSMLAFVGANAQSYHFFEAAELLGDLAVSLESYDGAAKYYGALADKAPWPDYKMRGAVLKARALMRKGDFAAALTEFDAVIGSRVDTPAAMQQKLLAQAGKASCLAGTGAPAEGIAIAEEIITKNSPEDNAELFGRTYNALGACYLKAGKPKEALMAYLHVDVLFYANPEVHAEALYNLSKLWLAMKKQDRADSARNLLTDRYAGSVWAKTQ
ncbi:MAG: tetratricopeptide repeat protein [Planctomycetaceae bacterium]|nr:tetratricopeptide repeat protein [Planctomycetales bacterium]MCB9938297.1 tetratricopeptide repeat protein [Planctomycetaceae bacterium]